MKSSQTQSPHLESSHFDSKLIGLALPKGRMFDELIRLLNDAGIRIWQSDRGYRPTISLPNFSVKILKPRNVIGMLEIGARDIGFAGDDWIQESGVSPVPLLDTELNPVRLVAAAPESLLENGRLPERELLIATEYPNLTRKWITAQGLNAMVLTTFGATEVFPPEDADMIVDNTASGSTLKANGLTIVDELMRSTSRLYASQHALEQPAKRAAIEDFAMLLRSVLEARKRVMVDLNVSKDHLNDVIAILPCMRQPTVSQLNDENWYAVRAAIPRADLTRLIPALRSQGACDIVITRPEQIIP